MSDAATRMVAAAETRERAKAAKALRRWLPLRQAQLALERGGRPPEGDVATDADRVDALLAAWGAVEAFVKAESGS